MSLQALIAYGMREIGKARLLDGRFIIELNDDPTIDETECIYAFLAGDEIVRIGSSSGPLRRRMKSWERDVSRALAGDFKRTRESEAQDWRVIMHSYGEVRLFSRKGSHAVTPIGSFNLYLAEESLLIGRHKPRLCHDRSRHRDVSIPTSSHQSRDLAGLG